jgi:hypothetical protein
VTKTDDILLELNRTFANYIEGVGQFKHEGKTYRTANYFFSSHYMKCDICGNFPRISIFIIKSDVDKLRVGNECIDRITNQNVSKRFKDYRRKRKNVIGNRRYIDSLASILTTYRSNKLPFHVSENDMGRLQKAFERVCKGLNPTTKQEQLAKFYTSRIARATNQT